METFAEVEEEEEEQEEDNGKLDKKDMPGEWCHMVHTVLDLIRKKNNFSFEKHALFGKGRQSLHIICTL